MRAKQGSTASVKQRCAKALDVLERVAVVAFSRIIVELHRGSKESQAHILGIIECPHSAHFVMFFRSGTPGATWNDGVEKSYGLKLHLCIRKALWGRGGSLGGRELGRCNGVLAVYDSPLSESYATGTRKASATSSRILL